MGGVAGVSNPGKDTCVPVDGWKMLDGWKILDAWKNALGPWLDGAVKVSVGMGFGIRAVTVVIGGGGFTCGNCDV